MGVLMVVLAIAGGSSRSDEPLLIIARLAAIGCGSAAMVFSAPPGAIAPRGPLMWLTILGALMCVQLVPLPPALWGELSGRQLYSDIGRIAGESGLWRPLSLAPDDTLNSLLSLLPPLAAVLCLSRIPRERHFELIVILGSFILLTAIIGIVQVSTGTRSLYFYRITNYGIATGLFANRNHQALALALGFPWLAFVLRHHRAAALPPGWRLGMACSFALLLLVGILLAGSRAGLLVGALAMIGSLATYLFNRRKGRSTRRFLVQLGAAVVGTGVLFVAGVLALGERALTIARLGTLSVASDGRAVLLEPNIELARIYFPWGIGFGAFAKVFRVHEPDTNLATQYLNHAHNDVLEWIIEAGLPAIVLGFAFLVGLLVRLWRGARPEAARDRPLMWLGAAWIAIGLCGSLFDYPLRTPIVAVFMVLAACFTLPAPVGKAVHRGARSTE